MQQNIAFGLSLSSIFPIYPLIIFLPVLMKNHIYPTTITFNKRSVLLLACVYYSRTCTNVRVSTPKEWEQKTHPMTQTCIRDTHHRDLTPGILNQQERDCQLIDWTQRRGHTTGILAQQEQNCSLISEHLAIAIHLAMNSNHYIIVNLLESCQNSKSQQ